MTSEAGQSGKQKQQQLGQAISDFYQSRYEIAQQMAGEQGTDQPLPIVATGHLTAMGVQTSESVRDIYVGSLEAFPANHFPPADYIALGHIHRPQKVSKSDTIRYCGSPIPLSFDELRSQKQVLLVDVAPGEAARVTELPVPMFQPMAQLKGDLEEIAEQLEALETAGELPVWLTIEVSAQAYLNDLQQRIQALTADYNVEVLQLRRSRVQKSEQAGAEQRETLAELNPQDVFEQRLAREDFSSESEQERLQRLRISFAQVLGKSGITLMAMIRYWQNNSPVRPRR
ncbi:exonuclease SbcCD subunit D C-terminal domain-containing protein [Aliamphritea spongicola]|nr:exonuclease SbcCD subunit D C-terminal domain-containing protein [Aliamphritea spongicola]